MATDGPLAVLLVEDSAGDARLIQDLLRAQPPLRLHWVETLAAARAYLAQPETDVVLLDLGLPDSQGLDTVTRLVRDHPTLPVIVL
ncbi:MAG: response regulator, partial [Candidatus Methylomirabilales bacterium]